MNNILSRNAVSVSGTGDQTIIFAHGFGCSQKTWTQVAAGFADHYRVVLFDYVGAGSSDLSAYDAKKYSTLEGYAQDLLDVCSALKVEDAIFVGHSVSCMIGVIAAIKQPSFFKKLVFVSPSPYFFSEGDYEGGLDREEVTGLFTMMEANYLGWSSVMAPLIMGNPRQPQLGAELTASFCATDPEIARQFARVTFFSDNRSYLPQLKVESLTLQCKDDMLAPVGIGSYIKDHTFNNTLVNMAATGHCPHLSAPDETIAVITDYLNNTATYAELKSYGKVG